MKSKDKPNHRAENANSELTGLSTEQLQQRLDAYCLQTDMDSQSQPVQDLLHELRVHQIELEMQSRELRESQQELEEARDRYADLYDFAPVAYINFDSGGCIREINLAGASLLGKERGRLLGKPFSLWLMRENNGGAFFAHLKQARESGRVETLELRLKADSSTPVDVRLETVVAHTGIDGKPSFRCVILDVSARKQAERDLEHQSKQVRLITDAIPAYIAYVDRHQRYRFVNKAYETWFPFRREGLIGKTVKEAVGAEAYAGVAHYIQRVLAGAQVSFDVSAPHPDGSTVDVNVNYIPDFNSDGTVEGYFVVNQNITEIRRREAVDKIHMLEAARVARINTMGEMVAELAHELNQPLAAITIYSDAVSRMLRQETPEIQDVHKALNEIRLQAGRAGSVITRLREFVSKRELQPETIQINALVEEVMKLISVEANWHGVEVKLELGDDIPPISLDRILIEQVVLNLARNAIEAMDAIERNRRQLVIRTVMGNYNEIEISVEDNGPGMAIEELEQIFEPFYTSKAHGMGMGLAISRSIIKAHHGRLWAIPNEHGGSTFTIILLYHQQGEDN